jgi:hypothetical protein
MLHRIMIFVLRVLLATLVAVVVMLLPAPPRFPAWVTAIQMPVTVLVLVCYTGKLLYDTLFYDHYQP